MPPFEPFSFSVLFMKEEWTPKIHTMYKNIQNFFGFSVLFMFIVIIIVIIIVIHTLAFNGNTMIMNFGEKNLLFRWLRGTPRDSECVHSVPPIANNLFDQSC